MAKGDRKAKAATAEKAARPAQLSEMATLSPDEVNWDIGDKLFQQRPLTLKRLSVVMNEIVDVLLGSGQGALLDQVVDTLSADGSLASKMKQAVMPVIVRTVVSVPGALPHICALILDESAEEYLDEHLRGRQAVAILKTFIEQNEVGALLQDFFGLMSSLQGSLTAATSELMEETEEPEETTETTEKEMGDDSSSENQKIAEASEPQ